MIALPRLLVLTDRAVAHAAGHDLVDVVAAALDAGAPAVLFREKDLAPGPRAELAALVAARVRDTAALLLVASDVALAVAVGADGVHLNETEPMPTDGAGLVGRSCHSGAGLDRAGHDGVAYATLSPVFTSISKPGYGPPARAELLAELAPRAGRPPVLALGGVTATAIGPCLAAGAWGAAVLGAVMGAADPAAATRSLVDALKAAFEGSS